MKRVLSEHKCLLLWRGRVWTSQRRGEESPPSSFLFRTDDLVSPGAKFDFMGSWYHFKEHKDRVSFLSFTDWNQGKVFVMCTGQQNSQSVCWNITTHADVLRGSSRVPAPWPRSFRGIAWRAERKSAREDYWKCVINLISLSPMHYRSFERVVCPNHIEPWLLHQHNRSSR